MYVVDVLPAVFGCFIWIANVFNPHNKGRPFTASTSVQYQNHQNKKTCIHKMIVWIEILFFCFMQIIKFIILMYNYWHICNILINILRWKCMLKLICNKSFTIADLSIDWFCSLGILCKFRRKSKKSLNGLVGRLTQGCQKRLGGNVPVNGLKNFTSRPTRASL